MLTYEEFYGVTRHLTGEDLFLRVAALEDLRDDPSADTRILPYLEQMLHDKTPCLVAIPYLFAEIRWLAAYALAAEREALGISEPIHLLSVVKPINTAGISNAEEAANIEFKGGVEGVLENFALLRSLGYLPMYDLYLSPLSEQSPFATTATETERHLELIPA